MALFAFDMFAAANFSFSYHWALELLLRRRNFTARAIDIRAEASSFRPEVCSRLCLYKYTSPWLSQIMTCKQSHFHLSAGNLCWHKLVFNHHARHGASSGQAAGKTHGQLLARWILHDYWCYRMWSPSTGISCQFYWSPGLASLSCQCGGINRKKSFSPKNVFITTSNWKGIGCTAVGTFETSCKL